MHRGRKTITLLRNKMGAPARYLAPSAFTFVPHAPIEGARVELSGCA